MLIIRCYVYQLDGRVDQLEKDVQAAQQLGKAGDERVPTAGVSMSAQATAAPASTTAPTAVSSIPATAVQSIGEAISATSKENIVSDGVDVASETAAFSPPISRNSHVPVLGQGDEGAPNAAVDPDTPVTSPTAASFVAASPDFDSTSISSVNTLSTSSTTKSRTSSALNRLFNGLNFFGKSA